MDGREYYSDWDDLEPLGISVVQVPKVSCKITIDTSPGFQREYGGIYTISFYPPGQTSDRNKKYLEVDTIDAPQYCYVQDCLGGEEKPRYQIWSTGEIESWTI